MVFDDDDTNLGDSGTGSTKGLVRIQVPEYSRDDVALAEDKLTVMIELRAAPSAVVREGLDLVAVLDVSGSMADPKNLGSMKQAMRFVIMKLNPVDRLCVVTFNNRGTRQCVLRSVTGAGQKELLAIVDRLDAHGGSNIESGLVKAKEVLAGRRRTEARTANVILISDGGQTANDAIDVDLEDAGVYTFGVGKHSADELLNAIATKSPGGTFSTVREGSDLTTPFAQVLGGLLTVVAQDVELTLTPESGSLQRMEVRADTDYTMVPDKRPSGLEPVTVKLGNLFSGEARKVIVDMELPASKSREWYHAILARAQHKYTAQAVPQGLQIKEIIKIKRTPNPSPVSSSITTRWVEAELARRRHADAIREAMAMADAGDMDGARYRLVDAQNTVEDELMMDGCEKMLDSMRAELAQLVHLMQTPELYKQQGRAYALAAGTSHGRQRFADRGDRTDPVTVFSTPRMDTYREQAKKFVADPSKPPPSAADDVKDEILANPMAAFSSELALHLQTAIQALQAIQKIVTTTN
ncbi:uncharacterized protein LOC112272381 [Brachypodium distachyon]|uniref:VWFA domain-containing protein n=1 Tax=Brachypodium distachyon TaxID=15368 RepID=I1IK17_BRADI|nr:uncharacterized protein LOC112272381 [Brachypodium distachyon]KQJ87619.1 hypothetical protein BRADI_4g12350v3 [Brachypodium distachyon]|eukprot:XP_024318790.1 uncharacterized protein LOC112272381 [Brachypodium distachyon]